jgi:hypothetical protein
MSRENTDVRWVGFHPPLSSFLSIENTFWVDEVSSRQKDAALFPLEAILKFSFD